MALGMRDLHRHLRETTGEQTLHTGFTRQDRSRFLAALENEIGFSVLGDFRDDLQDDTLYAFECLGIGFFQRLTFSLNVAVEIVYFLLKFMPLFVQRFSR